MLKYYTIITNGESMVYKRKTVTVKREDFSQLILYIQQVEETISVLRCRRQAEFKLDDWLTAIEIHAEFMLKQLNKITQENGYEEHLDMIKKWAEEDK